MRSVLCLVALLSVVSCGKVSRPGADAGDGPATDGGDRDDASGGDAGGDDAAPPGAFASCSEIRAADPDAGDGPYMIDPGGGEIEVYCVMTGAGTTYEALGFGNSFSTYADHLGVTATHLANARIQRAFLWLYNQQGGAINLEPGWNSGNCCFKGHNSNVAAVLTFGSNYLYPAEADTPTVNCSEGYASARYRFALASDKIAPVFPPDPLPDDFFTTYPPGEATTCIDENNPGWFFKRY
jgi:hypothetical protein